MLSKTGSLNIQEIELLETISHRLITSWIQESDKKKFVEFESILNDFKVLKETKFDLINVLKLKNNSQNVHLLCIKLTYRGHSVNSAYQALMSSTVETDIIIGYFETKKSLGNILIRPETMGDKITELFSKTEIDFESNPKFSNRYYLLTDNCEQTKKNINPLFLTLIEEKKNLHLEINNNKTFVTSLAKASISEAVRMADFCKKASIL